MFRLGERFAHPRQPASYACSSVPRILSGRAESLAPVFVPAAHELGCEGRFLSSAHRPHQLFGELAADDLEQSVIREGRYAAAMRLANHVPEHQVRELGGARGFLQVSVLGSERAWLASCHVDGPEPSAK